MEDGDDREQGSQEEGDVRVEESDGKGLRMEVGREQGEEVIVFEFNGRGRY